MKSHELRSMIREELRKVIKEDIQEKMREGPPPEDPGREGVGKSLFQQAAAKNRAQGNKRYVAEKKHTIKETDARGTWTAFDWANDHMGPLAGRTAKISKQGHGTFAMTGPGFLYAGDAVVIKSELKRKQGKVVVKVQQGGAPSFWVDAHGVELVDKKF